MLSLSHVSLRNRALVALIAVAALLFGGFTTSQLDQELFPPTEVPVAMVTASYPGASPETVEDAVTVPLEETVREVEGVTGYSSTSSRGTSSIQVEFDYGDDQDDVVRSLRLAMTQAIPDLPDEVEPRVLAFDVDNLPVISFAVSTNGDEQELVEPLESTVVPELEAIDGVQDVTLEGGHEDSVVLTPDEDALEDHDLTTSDVVEALESSGVVAPGGEIVEDDRSITVTAGAPLSSVEEVEDLWLPEGDDDVNPFAPIEAPDAVQLSELVDVELEPSAESGFTRTDGEPSLGVMVMKAPNGNTVEISEQAREIVDDGVAALGSDVSSTVVYDQAPFIQESVASMVEAGGLGLVAALLVIVAFLWSLRSTVVTAVSIPTSLLLSLVGMNLLGYTLNILTLAALAISVGRVVDDSIVVVENIKRHIAPRRDRMAAVRAGVREVSTAVSSSTLITLVAFAPLGLVGGQAGELFRPFSVTVAIALASSLLVAFTVVPVLAYWLLPTAKENTSAVTSGTWPARFRAGLPPGAIQTPYVRVLRTALRWPRTVVVSGVALFFVSLMLLPFLNTAFLEESGDDTVYVTQELAPGTPLEVADAEAARIEEQLDSLPWVASYQASVGSGQPGAPSTGGTSVQYTISFDDGADHATSVDRLREELSADAGPLTFSNAGAVESGLEVRVHADDVETLREAADTVAERMGDIPDVADVTHDMAASQPELRVEVDRESTIEAGLTEGDVVRAVGDAFHGVDIGTVTLDEVDHDLLLQPVGRPGSAESLEELEIATPNGEDDSVELADVADIDQVDLPPELTREDSTRTATVSGNFTGSDLGAVTAEIERAAGSAALPPGATAEVAGVSADQSDAFLDLLLAMLAAVVLVYILLVATLRSLVQPLILLVSVPFVATGAILVLLVTGIPLGVSALVGGLMLIGIVVTNAIVLMDFINKRRAHHEEIHEAVIEGARQRIRPILMTSLSTIGALVPLTVGISGGGGFVSQGLALVTIGGLVSSTLLTVIIIPVLYTMFETAKRRFLQRRVDPDSTQPSLFRPHAFE
ncbi:efflux RND transporter permease subunit [Spiractinospora alimapuensis]|uniref:efflux RND transporter permease subunit n=1 Tax=Spiractinospora alimapuensis TaxID=2820884 RepID=UPI001F289DEA|nr:efflux RND transporter permease subunit [Spiractinospora alimapuensis]QVQ50233.1 efflux RND transporter permease subunit [Spiractinospora alimapuensis]